MASCLSELFVVLRFCALDGDEFTPIIQWGLSTNDLLVLRHCLGMLLEKSADAPEQVAQLLQGVLSNSTMVELVSGDSLAGAYLCRLCWSLYEQLHRAEYLTTLSHMVVVKSETTSLLAIELICQLPYDSLSTLSLGSESGSRRAAGCSSDLLATLCETILRLSQNYVQQQDNLGMIAIIRPLLSLAHSLIARFGSRSAITGSAVLDSARAALDKLFTLFSSVASHSLYLQTSCLQLLLWLVNAPTDATSKQQYLALIQQTRALQPPPSVARAILHQLTSRALSTPAFGPFAVEVAWSWFLQNPACVTVDSMTRGWCACLAQHDVASCEYVLDVGLGGGAHQHVFALMDFTTPSEEFDEQLAELKCAAFWFLGETADIFVNTLQSAACARFQQPILLRLQKAALLGDWKVGARRKQQ